MTTVIERTGMIGHVVAERYGPDGDLLARVEVHNLLTAVGDEMVSRRAAGVGTLPAAPTGMRLGTSGVAATKTGAGAALGARVTGGNKAFDNTYPQWASVAGTSRVTWRCEYGPGQGTSATALAEVVLVNDTISSDTATAAANTIARAVLPNLGAKGNNDTVILTWAWDHVGS